MSEFSSDSFSSSTQELRPTQMSVAKQLRNTAAFTMSVSVSHNTKLSVSTHLVILTILDERQHEAVYFVQNLLETDPQLFEV